MLNAKELYKALRWRFIPVRYAGKVRRSIGGARRMAARPTRDRRIGEFGYDAGPTIPAALIDEIRALYAPRVADVVPTSGGHPFQNLFVADDLDAENPVFRFAMSPEVFDRAVDYFGGRMSFDSIQYLYSWPTDGALLESQKWHRDFGDSKSLHCVAYVNDVTTDADGPFVFVDRKDTRNIGRSMLIRRIEDERFARELGDGEIRRFYGKAGESVLIDPAACYHYGSRCRTPRHAIFVTFNTDRPYVAAIPTLRDNGERAFQAARQVRPDLDEALLRRVFGV
jgi:hypothetical protein